jgi:inosine-uridine nucleoside N-ribohydrolase
MISGRAMAVQQEGILCWMLLLHADAIQVLGVTDIHVNVTLEERRECDLSRGTPRGTRPLSQGKSI